LVAHVAAGLDTLHANGIIRRDVKPANIMLQENGDAALTDFGLAKGRAYTVLTRAKERLGTPDYMAPELIVGKQASPASDIYALGCVVFKCVTGKPPFAGKAFTDRHRSPPRRASPTAEPARRCARRSLAGRGAGAREGSRPEADHRTAYAQLIRVALKSPGPRSPGDPGRT
jgi:serine/threonine protein kinase